MPGFCIKIFSGGIFIKKSNIIATFRYSVIAPLVCQTERDPIKNKSEFFQSCAKTYNFLGFDFVVTKHSAKRWYYNYLKNSEALINKKRNRVNVSSKVSTNIINIITNYFEETPKINSKAIYKKLFLDGHISYKDFSYPTLVRAVNKLKEELKRNKKHSLPWEKARANDLWQADTTYAGYINKKRVYIISIIDDASRYIVGHGLFYNDNTENFQLVLKDALIRHGIPKMLYLDNGSPYRNNHNPQICAKLGINLLHAKPYTPMSKGKIEKAFLTMKQQWLRANKFEDFEVMKKSLQLYFESEYNLNVHSTLKESPLARYLRDNDYARHLSKDIIEDSFIFSTSKKVNNIATFVLNKKVYEVPPMYIGRSIDVYYKIDYSYVAIKIDDQFVEVKETDRITNASIKRIVNL